MPKRKAEAETEAKAKKVKEGESKEEASDPKLQPEPVGDVDSTREDQGDAKEPSLDEYQNSTEEPSPHKKGVSNQDEAKKAPPKGIDILKPKKEYFLSLPNFSPKTSEQTSQCEKLAQLTSVYLPEDLGSEWNSACWIYAGPRPAQSSIVVTWHFSASLEGAAKCSHPLRLHIGAALRNLSQILSDEEKASFLKKDTFPSHLCGNWRCCNPLHIKIENRTGNSTRKKCIAEKLSCVHTPHCLSDLKLPEPVIDAFSKYAHDAKNPRVGDGKPSISIPKEFVKNDIKPFVLVDEADLYYMGKTKRTRVVFKLSQLAAKQESGANAH